MIDRYNAAKTRSAKAGKLQMLFCVITLAADTVITAIFYGVCAIHLLVFTFLSKPNMSTGTASYTVATIDTAEPNELFALGTILFVIVIIKLIFAVCSIVLAVRRIGVRPMLGISSCLFCFVNLIFSVISLTFPESYSEPVFIIFLIVNIVFTLLMAACVYLILGKGNIADYLQNTH